MFAPGLLWAETASSLREGVYRGVITAQAARDAMNDVLAIPILLVHSPDVYHRALALAEQLGWAKAYDALYLATAEHAHAELLTLDSGLHQAAGRLGIAATLIAD